MIQPSSIRLVIRNLTVTYGQSIAVEDLQLEVANETVVLFGPSGCGKTTILKSILGVKESAMKVSGSIMLDAKPINNRAGEIGMVFQGPVIPSWLKVSAICRLGSKIRILPPQEQISCVTALLNRFGIAHLAERYPYQLSGGQKQRVALAATLINTPQVLLLDEPTSFIDGLTQMDIWEFLENIAREVQIPILIVSHDPRESVFLADRIIVLDECSRIKGVIDVPIAHPRSIAVERSRTFTQKLDQLLQLVGRRSSEV